MSNLDLYDDLFPDETLDQNARCKSKTGEEVHKSLHKRKEKGNAEHINGLKETNEKLQKELDTTKHENKENGSKKK